MAFDRPYSLTPPDGSITAAKLAPDSVTAGAIAPGAVDTADIFAAGVVDNPALAPGSVSVAELQNDTITLAKMVAAAARETLHVKETMDQHVGASVTTSKRIRGFELKKKGTKNKISGIVCVAEAKIDDATAGKQGFLELWVDEAEADWDANDIYTGAGAPAASIPFTSTAFSLVELIYDGTLLADGKHEFVVAVKASTAGMTVDVDGLHILGEHDDDD